MRVLARNLIGLPLLMVGLLACGDSLQGSPSPATVPSVLPPAASTLPPAFTPTATRLPTATPPATPRFEAGEVMAHAQAMAPEHEQDLTQFDQATRYGIEVRVEFSSDRRVAELTGTAQIRFTNPSSTPLDEVPLMLWPNDLQYSGEMEIGAVWVDGKQAETSRIMGGLGRMVNLPGPVRPAQTIQLLVSFQVSDIQWFSSMSPRRFGISEGVLFAPTFYPLIPRLVGTDWSLESAMPGGDTTNSETAFYTVQITAPADQALVTSGVEIDRQVRSGETHRVTFVSGPTRDFAFALGPLESFQTEFQGTHLRIWLLEEHRDSASSILDAVVKQFSLLTELVGAYPYSEFDLVDLPGAFGGIEYPGLVTVGTVGTLHYLAPTIHEVGHQWFYGLIGSDQLLEPWLDEGAATYTEVLYHERYSRAGTDTGMLTSFRDQVRSRPDPDLPIGKPVGAYPELWDYVAFVYSKGALFFDALRSELGDDLFFTFLRTYYQSYRYQFSSGADFQRLAEEVCVCKLDPLFELWVEQGGEIPGL